MPGTTVTLLATLACPARLADVAPDPTDARVTGARVILVDKAARRAGLYDDGLLVTLNGAPACWPVGLAPDAPTGPKRREGDRRTPEGWYRTSDKPWSSFPGALAVHYPGAHDARRALEEGVIDAATGQRILDALRRGEKPPQDTALGGEILLHGGGGSSDWTLGCVALDDADLTTLRAALPAGQRTDLLLIAGPAPTSPRTGLQPTPQDPMNSTPALSNPAPSPH